MAEMRIKIGSADAVDISTWKLHLIKSPSVMAADVKENNVVTKNYPENDGEDFYINPTPKLSAFDYEVTFAFYDGNLNTANSNIYALYSSMLGKTVTIYNDYKGQKMVGYVKSYKEGEFYRNTQDIVVFSITFRVPKPSLCNFSGVV